MRLQPGHVIFETDLICTEPVYVDRTNTGDYSYNKSGEGVSSPVQHAVPISGDYGHNGPYVAVTANPVTQQPASQFMIVQVPLDAGPGSVLSVTAPNGLVLSVWGHL